MADRYSQLAHILYREDREFEEVMREQVGTIFLSTNGLDNVEFCFKSLIGAGVITHCTKIVNFRLKCPLNHAHFPKH